MAATDTGPAIAPPSTPAEEVVIYAERLAKRFGPVRALDGFSLEVVRGESFGLLGPNGSGKTTFIRSVVGLLRPDDGTLTVLGYAVPAKAEHVRPNTGYMTQLYALYNDLSVWENVSFFARIFGISDPGQRASRITEVLELVELMHRKDAPVSTLSGGMRQRLSLACALVHNPTLLLLDEPTVGVDPQLRQTFWGYFRALNERGVTILVSSHVMDEADRCDRLGLVRSGRVLAVGTPDEVRALGGSQNLEVAFLNLSQEKGEERPQ
jgi:ABC-2 type transport system ATP-binding protein